MRIAIISSLLILAAACVPKNSLSPSNTTLQVKLEPKGGSSVSGTALFDDDGSKVSLTAKLSGLSPGVHAIHIHEKADCSAADASSAGGHWNPTFRKHGKWGEGEYHRGDIGNFTADADGNATVIFTSSEWCIGCADQTKDITGKGLIVHEKADDFTTQPSGNAGGRVACAGLIR